MLSEIITSDPGLSDGFFLVGFVLAGVASVIRAAFKAWDSALVAAAGAAVAFGLLAL